MKQEAIKLLMPAMFRLAAGKNTPLDAVFSVMEALHDQTETTLRKIDAVFDPLRTNERFVPYLAGWVDLDWVVRGDETAAGYGQSAIPTEHFRKLVSLAWYLSKWRGTAAGLKLFLETATGVEGFSIDERPIDNQGRIIPFHIEITVPEAAADRRHLVERIIENEKPAYVTYRIVNGDE